MFDGKDTIHGAQEGKQLIKKRSEAIPDYHCTVDDILVAGNKAAVRWHSTGKAIKDFANFKAGKNTNYSGMSMFELKDGLIVKVWEYGTAVDIVIHS